MTEQTLEGEHIMNNIRTIHMTDLKSMLKLINWLSPKRFELKSVVDRNGKPLLELVYVSDNRE